MNELEVIGSFFRSVGIIILVADALLLPLLVLVVFWQDTAPAVKRATAAYRVASLKAKRPSWDTTTTELDLRKMGPMMAIERELADERAGKYLAVD